MPRLHARYSWPPRSLTRHRSRGKAVSASTWTSFPKLGIITKSGAQSRDRACRRAPLPHEVRNRVRQAYPTAIRGDFSRYRSSFLPKIHLVLIVHAHQPVGNFDHVFEQLYRQSYLPFLEQVERHPAIRLGLHYTGPLLEWLDARHPEFLERLEALAERHQVEIIGGAFYEPILISIPRADQAEQIRRMRAYLSQRFGQAPMGAWLAVRWGEPHLPAVFEAARVDYTLLDDIHFLCAGLEAEQLFGYYVAEEGGATVKVIPGLQAMRYLVPFHTVDESIAYLRDAAERHPDGMVASGDDCEKVGGWPGTYEHCYTNGWLDKFFAAVEKNSDWLATTPPGEYLATHAPLGRADLPAASYTEMMEWVLPTTARQQFHTVESEFTTRPD